MSLWAIFIPSSFRYSTVLGLLGVGCPLSQSCASPIDSSAVRGLRLLADNVKLPFERRPRIRGDFFLKSWCYTNWSWRMTFFRHLSADGEPCATNCDGVLDGRLVFCVEKKLLRVIARFLVLSQNFDSDVYDQLCIGIRWLGASCMRELFCSYNLCSWWLNIE